VDKALGAPLDRPGGSLVEYRDSKERQLSASIAATPQGWRVVAQQSAREATAAGDRMRLQTLFWIAVAAVAALAAGMFLARAISRPVRELAKGARELAGGNLGYRVAVTGRDELGGLALAFNRMSEEIAQRNAEIEAFNAELQARVDERTRQLREAEQQLLRSQKLAAVSSLAAGVAHEINNPLTGVLGIAQLLKAQAGDDAAGSKRVSLLGQIETEAKRIRDIVQSMLSLSEEEAGKGFVEVDLAPIVSEALAVVAGQLSSAGVELVQDLPDSAPAIRGNGAQLLQLFAHLLSNAIGAMKSSGKLTVCVRSVAGELLEATVTDTGHGIPPEHLDRVFEPFFTTKQQWQRRGLGLAVAYRIVEQHNGKISIHSEVDVGTTVTVTIPIARGGAHLV
jgi:signal transduction histidine kinase